MNDEEIIVDVGVGDGKSALRGAPLADNGCGGGALDGSGNGSCHIGNTGQWVLPIT